MDMHHQFDGIPSPSAQSSISFFTQVSPNHDVGLGCRNSKLSQRNDASDVDLVDFRHREMHLSKATITN
ncbi:hypothetical protein ABKN59_010882 [Abortiporus biennis]